MLLADRPHELGAPGWIYELKFDGYRLMALVDQGKATLISKSGADATAWFPEVASGLAAIPGGPHLLDGEAVVLDELGRSSFERLHARARRRRWYPGADPVVFATFDLLVDGGQEVTALPVLERKARLARLLDPAPASALLVGHFDADHGPSLFANAVIQLGLEGLVAKRLESPYRPGTRSPDWVKVKRQGAVLPGFRRPPAP